MINDGINNVPDKTIVIFIQPKIPDSKLSKERILNIVKKCEKKRDWFTPHFYRCLPLTIGNQYGFTISLEFDIGFEWKGGNSKDETLIYSDPKVNNSGYTYYPNISSHFGHGIVTINPPIVFRTPPGVNLLTINPPNHILSNITVMTGVVETDNLRRNFTFNLKLQIPNIKVVIPAGTPLAAFIPVPRYYCDEFELDFAENIFNQEIIDEELKASQDATQYRENVEPNLKNSVGRHYFKGTDVYGNPFPDHQTP